MTFDEFKDDLELALGGNLVSVELEEKEYEFALKRAIKVFQQKGHNTYRRKFHAIETVEGVQSYDIPNNIMDGIKVIRPNTSGEFSSEDLFVRKAIDELIPSSSRLGGCNGIQFLEYEMVLQTLEKYKRYTAYDVDFQIDKFQHKVKFFNQPKRDGEIWFLECYENLTDEEYMEVDWIFRWALTEAKIILGQAYRKFSSLPSPDGSTTLSGSEMINEAKEEQRMLLEEITELTDGAIDYYGVYVG
jgi:hypothetical protein